MLQLAWLFFSVLCANGVHQQGVSKTLNPLALFLPIMPSCVPLILLFPLLLSSSAPQKCIWKYSMKEEPLGDCVTQVYFWPSRVLTDQGD